MENNEPSTTNMVPLTVGQLKTLLADVDDEQEIRVWVERTNEDGIRFFEGRKLVGIADEEKYCCLCAALYSPED